MTLVYVLLVAHFVADFLCQTDWMALNKSKRWDALGAHVLVYSVVLGVFVLPFDRPGAGLFLLVNAATHFVQDALTSRLTSRLWFIELTPWKPDDVSDGCYKLGTTRHWFFVAIGFDQLLHYVALFLTAGWWLR